MVIISTDSKNNNNNAVGIKRKKFIFRQQDEQEDTDRVRELHRRLVTNAFKMQFGMGGGTLS